MVVKFILTDMLLFKSHLKDCYLHLSITIKISNLSLAKRLSVYWGIWNVKWLFFIQGLFVIHPMILSAKLFTFKYVSTWDCAEDLYGDDYCASYLDENFDRNFLGQFAEATTPEFVVAMHYDSDSVGKI